MAVWPWALAFLILAKPRGQRGGGDPHAPDPEDPPMPDADELVIPPQPPPGPGVVFPLPGSSAVVRCSSFGQGRPFKSKHPTRLHTGIDLRAPYLAPVVAPEESIVAKITGWDGKDTRAVILQSLTGLVIVLGAVSPRFLPPLKSHVKRGELVTRIGRYPGGSTMLHFELWKVGALDRPRWLPGKQPPSTLIDPCAYLEGAIRT